MTTIKTADLEGIQLDAWVARAEGLEVGQLKGHPHSLCAGRNGTCVGLITGPALEIISQGTYWPSREWNCGGPIIEREHIETAPSYADDGVTVTGWTAMMFNDERSPRPLIVAHGRLPLIAAMRAFVASKFGDEVQEVKVP